MPNHGGGGRKRKPKHLHLVQGTFRPDRHGDAEAKPSTDLPSPPAWLNERSAELFHELLGILQPMGIASSDFRHMLAMAASALWEVEHFTAIIEDLGTTYTTVSLSGSISYKFRPEVAGRQRAMKISESFLARFGLSPADVSKVNAAPAEADNPFAALA
jgi:hypothetical protein